MNKEDKIIRKNHILNNSKKLFEVSTALVLWKEIWVVVSCGIVTPYRCFEHRYRLHPQGCECPHKLEDKIAMFPRNVGKQLPNRTAQQRRRPDSSVRQHVYK
jgi:hypothetical protein